MNQVHVNGVALLPGIDYRVSQASIIFNCPPAPGDQIVFTEVLNPSTGSLHRTTLNGNGRQYMFKLDRHLTDREVLSTLFEKVITHYDHPAVKEALERLKVVVELIND